MGDGSVIGVIPDVLQPREVSGKAVGEVRVVSDMHTRKVGDVLARVPCVLSAARDNSSCAPDDSCA
jgi:hypothetical protein